MEILKAFILFKTAFIYTVLNIVYILTLEKFKIEPFMNITVTFRRLHVRAVYPRRIVIIIIDSESRVILYVH